MHKNCSSQICLIFLLSVLFVSSACLVNPVKAEANVEVVSHVSYVGHLSMYVVGEVQNTGDQPVEWVEITATFYDSNDSVMATEVGYSGVDVILPERKSPFHIILLDETMVANVDHYSLSVSYEPTVAIEEKLSIVSDSSYIDELGGFIITGEVENTANTDATSVRVYATCYDESGNVVDTGMTNIYDPIPAGQTASFEVTVLTEDIETIASYQLTPESAEYAAIPEFSTLFMCLLVAPFVGLAVIVLHKKTNQ
ncbi:MAG: FxLYD domain-containing protein [archaeon]